MKLNKNYKSFAKAYKIYQEMLKNDEILPIKEIDDLGKYFGKKGNPLKKKTSSEKAKREFNEALRKYNKRFGTGASARLKKEAKKQEESLEKAIRTSQAKSTGASGKIGGVSGASQFTAIAQRELQKRKEEAKAFSSGLIGDARDKLNIGSDVIHYLATEKGSTSKMIEDYLENMAREYEMLTPIARELADTDTVNKALKDLSDYYGKDAIPNMLEAYLKGVERDDIDGMFEAFDYYQTHKETAPMTFDEFVEALENYDEWSEKNFEEIFDEESDGE